MDPLQEIQDFIEHERSRGRKISERSLSMEIGSQSLIQRWRYGACGAYPSTARRLADRMDKSGWWATPEIREAFINALIRLERKPALEPTG